MATFFRRTSLHSESGVNFTVTLGLFTEVSNAKELRECLMRKEFNDGVTFLKAKLLTHPDQALISAQKAALAFARSKMVTRTMGTEVIYNVSSSKNITDSLKTFGIGDDDSELLMVAIAEAPDSVEGQVRDKVKGQMRDLDELNPDPDLIAKAHKLKNVQLTDVELSSLLISRTASKDIGL